MSAPGATSDTLAADRSQILTRLEAAGHERLAPASLGQRRLWFVDRLVPGGVDYTVVWPLRLVGSLDVAALSGAVADLVGRHEVLRTRFVAVDGEPFQVVDPPGRVAVPVVDLSGLADGERAGVVAERIRAEAEQGFDVAVGPLARWRLLRVGASEHVLLMAFHHIVFDGWSCSVLSRDLSALYAGRACGAPVDLPDLAVQFADFAVWERRWLTGPVRDRQLAFWREHLAGVPPVLDLPTDAAVPARRSGGGARERIDLPAQIAGGLAQLCQAEGATTFMGLLAALSVVLGRYAATDDVVVGTFVANRAHPELEDLIGFFVNTLALRTDLSGDPSFREVLGRVRATTLDAFAHQDIPFDHVVEALAPPRPAGRTPYVQVALVVQNTPEDHPMVGDLTAQSLPTDTRTAAFDLTVHLWATPDATLTGFIDYATDLYHQPTIARLRDHLHTALHHALAAPDAPITTLELTTPTEHHTLRTLAEDHARAGAGHELVLPDLVAAQIADTPDATAISCGAQRLTYADLGRCIAAAADLVRDAGATPGTLVGVCIERSIESVIAVLGILAADCAYVPLDPANPAARLAHMVTDSATTLVITHPHLDHLLPDHLCRLHLPDWTRLADHAPLDASDAPPRSRRSPDDLAYVIYTSGSTGTPKGVAVSHGAAVSRVHRPVYAPITSDDVVMHALLLSFDVSVLEVFGALTNGAELAVLAGTALPERVGAFLGGAGVTVCWLTAALFHAVVDTEPHALSALRVLIAGGDQLSARHVNEALACLPRDARLVNGYGPTEAAIFAATRTFVPGTGVDGRVPIGGPIPDTGLHVLDRHGNLALPGRPGELCIGGGCLARGYLGRPDLTAERFVPHPYDPGRRLYRTGDLVRWTADGELVFLGRLDNQIKLRGFRVEPGEIEQVLGGHEHVGEVVVVARGDGYEQRRLVAYVAPADDVVPSAGELMERARGALPDYMVPAAFVVLPELPLTPNGKVDRAALPEPAGTRTDLRTAYTAPRDPIEGSVAAIWADVLGLDRVGVHDTFFDLGGHSLLAGRLIARIRRTFDRELSFADFFDAPTVAGNAAALTELLAGHHTARPPLRAGERPDRVPVALGQRRLWFVDRLVPGGVDYTVVWPLRLVGSLDVAALSGAVADLVGRHEVLRTRFVAVDGEPFQVVDPPGRVAVPVVDLSGLADGERAGVVAERIRAEAEQGFDVAVGPLARWRLLRVGASEHVLLMAFHHIVFDGWSCSVLSRDLSALYAGRACGAPVDLPDLAVQFADFAVWERRWLTGPVRDRQLAFWREHLAGVPPVLDLPTDAAVPARRSGGGARERIDLPAQIAGGLAQLCQAEGATTFMGLLAALSVVLGRYAATDDVVVGTFVANRAHPELEDLIGFFVNTLALRTDLSGDPSFREVLGRVRATTLDAFAHQDIPFDHVVEALAPPRPAGRTPYVQVALVVQNTPEDHPMVGDLTAQSLPTDTRTAAFDLTVHLWATPDATLTGFIDYATDLYHQPTIARLRDHLHTALHHALAAPDAPITTLELTTPTEHHTLRNGVAVGATRRFPDGAAAARFHAIAERRRDAVALVDAGRRVTYGELVDRAAGLAARLRVDGIGVEDPVGVCLDRGTALVVAALAVWWIGGVYVPLDPANPAARLAHMVTDSATTLVITHPHLGHLLPDHLCRIAPTAAEAEPTAPADVRPANLAAVIYTSGSTGTPKGVAVTHRTLLNRVDWFADEQPFRRGEVSAMKTPIASVDALWELLGALLHGTPTVVVADDDARDPVRLVDQLATHRVTRLLAVPTLLRMLLDGVPDLADRLPALRLWVSSGEPLSSELRDSFRRRLPGRALHNLYGAAEVWDALWPTDDSGDGVAVPVGTPIANVDVHVLDRAGHSAPIGVPGEVHVGGACLARGYLGRPDLTAERFVPHPYDPGRRLYRTGDLGRVGPDGQITLLGRVDHVVKIRGFRVDPGEIEQALHGFAEIRQAVVAAATTAHGTTRLDAFVVADDPAVVSELRARLGQVLPSHMVPTTVTALAALPLTASGKVDRTALPARSAVVATATGTPTTATERTVAEALSEVLEVRSVGVDDDFFDLGGHSLLAAQLAARLTRQVGATVPLRTIFDHPTVRGLAHVLDTDGAVVGRA